MSAALLNRIFALIAAYGLPILLPIAVVEGPAVAVVAGALVAGGELHPVPVVLSLLAADLLGDTLYYLLGFFSGAPLSKRISHWLKLSPERVEPLKQRFHDHDWKLLILGKVQPLGSIILYFAGLSRMNYIRYLAINLLCTLPKVLLFGAVGYFLASSIIHSMKVIDYVTAALLALAVLLLLSFFLARRALARFEARP